MTIWLEKELRDYYNMTTNKNFVSCDWGTSNFRIRLIDAATLDILKEIKTDVGVSKLYESFKQQSNLDQKTYFVKYLITQLEKIYDEEKEILVVASGMITSSIGMEELDYACLPISLDNHHLVHRIYELTNRVKLLSISGVKNYNDIMRGEEVQVLGLLEYDKINRGRRIVILPGTHSKHIVVEENRVLDFKTFMTGELFELLTRNSVVALSISKVDWDKAYKEVFLDGVKTGLDNLLLLHNLFSIRARDILKHTSKEENYFYLSGMLIGNELSSLKDSQMDICLASSGVLHDLYLLALTSFIPAQRLKNVNGNCIDTALIAAHKELIKFYA